MENQSSTEPMQFLLLEQVQFVKVQDDSLLQWELVDVVDAEEEESSDDDDHVGSVSSPLSSPGAGESPIEGIIHHPVLHLDADAVEHQHHHEIRYQNAKEQVAVEEEDDDDDDVVVDDDEEDDDRYDLDDELVPWDVANKFGRQRMRKLGKRSFPKMKSSKKSPFLYARPGCVGGKHGLGLKHSF